MCCCYIYIPPYGEVSINNCNQGDGNRGALKTGKGKCLLHDSLFFECNDQLCNVEEVWREIVVLLQEHDITGKVLRLFHTIKCHVDLRVGSGWDLLTDSVEPNSITNTVALI